VRHAVAALALGAAACACLAQDPPRGERKDISAALPEGFEPSGAAWHSGRNGLLLVGDEGQLALIEARGALRSVWSVGGDLEGVAVCDPDSALIYLLVESPPAILEFDLQTGSVRRAVGLGADLPDVPPEEGPESLACVPPSAPDVEPRLYVGVQHDGRILVYERLAGAGLARRVQTLGPLDGRRDLAALEYDAGAGTLWAVYDAADRLVALDRAGRKTGEWPLPEGETEGLAIGSAGWFLADDRGPVWRSPRRP
jgi:hypothetical protein